MDCYKNFIQYFYKILSGFLQNGALSW